MKGSSVVGEVAICGKCSSNVRKVAVLGGEVAVMYMT